MTQTTVSSTPALGIPGQLSTLRSAADASVDSATSEEASAGIPFGAIVKHGTADDGVLLPLATTDKLAGLVVFAQGFNRTHELDDDGLQPGATFGILVKGRAFVRVEDAVTPASEVHVRCVIGGANGYGTDGVGTTEAHGAVRGTADSTDCIDISAYARFVKSAAAKGIAEIDVDFTNVALGAAD